ASRCTVGRWGSGPSSPTASKVAASSPSSRWLAGAGTATSGSPHAPVARAEARVGDAAIHGELLQFKAEQPVIGGQHRMAQLLGHPGTDPLVPAAAQGGRRAGGVR